jgi:hypothetical protein
MTLDIHKAAAWVSVLGFIGLLIGQWRSSVDDARHLQQAADALYQRIGNDEGQIAFIKSQLPKDKQDILDAITEAQDRAQRQQDRENWAHVADEKAVVHEMVKTKALKPDAVSADEPTVR